jgi:1-acyl-sn-glycerol-3-phosphate acyltransferase
MKSHGRLVAVSYTFLRFLVKPLICGIWVKRTSGLNNLPKRGPAIIALNHQSFFDFLIFSVIVPRNVHFLTAEKFFEHPLWRILMLTTGQIKVNRKSEDKDDVHEAVFNHLSGGMLVAIFPEGTRSHLKDEMLKAYTGIAKYALQHHVPIIPVGIIGTYDILPKNEKKVVFKKVVEINIGEALHFPDYWDKHTDKEIRTRVTEMAIKKISNLSQKSYPHYEYEH